MSEVYLDLKQQINELAGGRPVTLVAVSKFQSVLQIKKLYDLGCRDFGESRVQEALEKIKELPRDIRWHFIGPLQSNKINKVIGKFSLIHSVDSIELAEKISQKSLAENIQTSILLQVNTSGEKTKQGFTIKECEEYFSALYSLKGISILGLMTMAPHLAKEEEIRDCFHKLKGLQTNLCNSLNNPLLLPHLSMGMSGDYKIAVQEGSTLVRIGTALFHT